jgi:uncharacterized protein
MPSTKDPWPPGTPAWVDVMATDFEGTKAFYADLFGWEYDEGGPEYGNYATARLNGSAVAGVFPAQGQDGPPPAWTTYLAVDSAEAVAARIGEAGGTVVMPVTQVGGFGTMAVALDPTGTAFGIWQAGSHTGFQLYNEPGADVWNEAMVGDYEAGKEFYAAVFGYGYAEIGGAQGPYSTIQLGDRSVGGIGPASLIAPEAAPVWRTYFAVADPAATCARAEELGGEVITEPFRTEFGAMAGIRAPGGESFWVNG